MAYNFLGLVNDVNQRVNEVELTSANFASAVGFYSTAKQAINSSIRFINQDTFTWPFNFTAQSDTLTAGDMRYSYPATAKFVDFNTFRIQRNATFGNVTQFLKEMTYEEYLQHCIDDEYNSSDTGIRSIPRYVVQAPSQEYLIYPSPDQAYALDYDYYKLPTDLSAYDDAPDVPAAYRHIVVDGAMYYVYFFRGDIETADRVLAKFEEGIKNMRSIYVNRYEYMRDTRVLQSYGYPTHIRTN